MQVRVTAGHAAAMNYYPAGYMARFLPKLVEAEMALAIAPNENLQLQGRDMDDPTPRGAAPVKKLVDAGLHASHMFGADYLNKALDFIQTNPCRNLGVSRKLTQRRRSCKLLGA